MKGKSSLASALAIAFLDNFGLSLVFILFAPLVLNPQYGLIPSGVNEGIKNLVLGLLIGTFPLFTFFGAPFWGDIGDLMGRKKAFIFTILGTLLGHLISAASIYFESLFFLFLSRGIAGFFSGNISLCLATISDLSVDPKKRAFHFGLLTVLMGVGWVSAMLVGGIFSDSKVSRYFNPVVPFLIVAMLTLIGYLLVQFLFKETHAQKEKVQFDWIKSFHEIKRALQIEKMRPSLIVLLIWSLGWFFTFQWFTAISLEKFHAPQTLISFYLSLLGAFWVFGGLFLNSLLVKRFSSRTLSLYSIFFTTLFIFLSSLSPNYFFFALFFWMAAMVAPISLSNIVNIVSLSAPEGVQGKAMGFTQSIQAVASILVPLIGGGLANFSISWIFPVSGIFLAVSFLFLALKKND